MRIYENETPKQLKQRLQKSVEVQHYLHYPVLLVVFMLLFGGIQLLTFAASGALDVMWKVTVPALILGFGPWMAFYLFRLVCVFRKWQHYRYYQVMLTRLDSSRWLGASRFIVVLEEKDGSKHIVNTHYIFTPKGLTNPSLDDYVGHGAVVGYNEETGQVVFLG